MSNRDDDTEVDEEAEATKREGPGSHRPDKVPKPPQEKLDRGTAVGRYIVIDVLGEGGMGVVYAAYDPELDRKVAVKLLQAKPAAGSTGDQAWLLREAQAMARLSHPNVLAVHDVGSLSGDRVFVAMELVEGLTLRKWLREKRTWREVVPVMLAAGAGLAAAHAGGLVHRDFKPDNVLVGNDGRVRVMDFGLARLRNDPDENNTGDLSAPPERTSERLIESKSPLSASLTIAGSVIGTPAYMAPEIYDGLAADARSDQYSFGVALYEALFRSRPFAKDAPRGSKPKPPPDVGVPARIQRVVMRAISIDPGERFPSMDELLAELGVQESSPRRRVLFAAGVVVALGAATVGGFALSSSSSSPPANEKLCTGTERRLAGAWDANTKRAVSAAFGATKLPFERKSYAGLERALDGYTADWTKVAQDSCEATRIRGEQTEEALELREACLDQRLDELRALTQLLGTADASLVEKGDKVVWALEPVSRCSNVAVLRAPGRPPTEPRDKLAELHKQLAAAKAGLIAGNYFPGMTAADRTIVLAGEVHYEPFKAEALLVRGACLAGVGNAKDAAGSFNDAVWSAMAGHRDDLIAGSALSAAAMASQDKVGEARIWYQLASHTIARIGRDSLFEQRRLQVEGLVAAASGDTKAATEAQLKALAAAERAIGPNNPALWPDLEVIAVTLGKAGAWDKALPYFERSMALREASVGPDHPDIAVILTNLGAAYSHIGDTVKSKAAYERAVAIRERTDGPQSPMLILTLNNMSDGMVKAGDPAGALYYADRATQLAIKLVGKPNPLYHAIATTRAEALVAGSKLDEARKQYDEVLALEAKTQSPYLGATLSSRANLELRASKWADAATFEQRAIAAMEATSGKTSPDLWQPLTGLAQANIRLKRPASVSRPLLERAIAIGEKAQISERDLKLARSLLKELGPG